MLSKPFTPYPGQTRSVASAAGVATINLSDSTGPQLLIVNSGTQLVHVRVTTPDLNAAATAEDMPILPNTSRVITREVLNGPPNDRQTRISVFAGAVGSTVYVTPGDGYGNT